MKRGTIILTPFPFTDLSNSKVRPALIVSTDKRNDNDNDIIIAFITSVTDAESSPETNIYLNSNESYFKETGLKVSSIIRTDKLATINKKIILGELGFLNTRLLNLVNEKLRIVLDIN